MVKFHFREPIDGDDYGTEFIILRGPKSAQISIKSDKGKCTYEVNPTYAHLDKVITKGNWTPIEAYKYK